MHPVYICTKRHVTLIDIRCFFRFHFFFVTKDPILSNVDKDKQLKV